MESSLKSTAAPTTPSHHASHAAHGGRGGGRGGSQKGGNGGNGGGSGNANNANAVRDGLFGMPVRNKSVCEDGHETVREARSVTLNLGMFYLFVDEGIFKKGVDLSGKNTLNVKHNDHT